MHIIYKDSETQDASSPEFLNLVRYVEIHLVFIGQMFHVGVLGIEFVFIFVFSLSTSIHYIPHRPNHRFCQIVTENLCSTRIENI